MNRTTEDHNLQAYHDTCQRRIDYFIAVSILLLVTVVALLTHLLK